MSTRPTSPGDQLGKLNTELSSAFGQVTGEMGALRTSVTSLSSQVAALTDLVTRLLPSRAGEINPTPPVAQSAAPPTVPPELLPDPRWEPTLSPPHSYAGEFDRCRGFLGQCELLFTHQASRYRTDGARVALIMSSLAGRALDWAVAAVGRNPQLSSCLPDFLEEFRRVFDHPSQGADAAGRLHSLQQGSRGVADYTLEFRTLAAESGWDDAALRSAYRRGLSEELKDLLVRDHPSSLNELSTLAHRLDDRLRERRLERAQRRETPHLPRSPKRPCSLEGAVLVSRANISSPPARPNSLFPVSLSWGLETLTVGALIDSGADECLMDVTLAHQAGVPLEPMGTAISAQALDGHTLGEISHHSIPISLTTFGFS